MGRWSNPGVVAMALMATAGAPIPFVHHKPPLGGETITYELKTGFCQRCASYVLTLGPDGQGIFTGDQNAAATGDRRFHASPAATRAFVERLAPYRPKRELLVTLGQPACRGGITDQDTLDIRWQSADGTSAHLAFYEGCSFPRKPKMKEALASAPSLLPIADLIGPH